MAEVVPRGRDLERHTGSPAGRILLASSGMKLDLHHSYADDLAGFSVPATPDSVPTPSLLFWNDELATSLGIDSAAFGPDGIARTFSGNELPEDARPVAQAYAGHQFGHFSPQLGDGRAHLLGEVVDPSGKRWDIALKGSGRTPFSRGGDGKAVVGPMLREVLIGEFLHACGIPTTRALAVVATGEAVVREVRLPGAVLTRVASSHIRVGTFEFFASRGEHERVRRLAEYAIARHDPHLVGHEHRFPEFLKSVCARQADLIARWTHVGFLHGVMNTDNMAVSGESIDFGPCAFLEAYDPSTVFSSIDHDGRYAFGNQPFIAQWNLARLCETFLPLLDPDVPRAVAIATEIVESFAALYRQAFLAQGLAKLGLACWGKPSPVDELLLDEWLLLLHRGEVDFTLAWRHLSAAAAGDEAPLRRLFAGVADFDPWFARWIGACAECDVDSNDGPQARAAAMRGLNPLHTPRNHQVERALKAATERADLAPFHSLLEVLRAPFDDHPGREHLAEPAPAEVTSRYRTFCGT